MSKINPKIIPQIIPPDNRKSTDWILNSLNPESKQQKKEIAVPTRLINPTKRTQAQKKEYNSLYRTFHILFSPFFLSFIKIGNDL